MIANNVIALGSTVVFARLLTRLRLAGRADQLLPDSVGGRPGAAGGDRPRGRARPSRRGRRADAPPSERGRARCCCSRWLLTVVSVLLRDTDRASAVGVKHDDQWAAADRPARRPACGWAVDPPRRPAGRRRLQERRPQPRRRAGRAAGDRRASWRRSGLGVTGAYLGTPISFIAMSAVLHDRAAPARTRRRAPSRCAAVRRRRGGAQPLGARQARLGADRRADRDRGAAEHRHHRRQAPLRRDAPGQLLRRHRGRRQGADLGGDRRRLLPGARGLAAPRRGRGPAPDPGPGAGHRRGVLGPGPAHLRLRLARCCIKAAFGASKTTAADSLLVLGLAFAVLACTYLAIQYMLALRRTWFLVIARRRRRRRADPAAQRLARAQELRRGGAGDPGGRRAAGGCRDMVKVAAQGQGSASRGRVAPRPGCTARPRRSPRPARPIETASSSASARRRRGAR